jgi:hypothetical protein
MRINMVILFNELSARYRAHKTGRRDKRLTLATAKHYHKDQELREDTVYIADSLFAIRCAVTMMI